MYERHFNLIVKPFAMNPDPMFLYRSLQHAGALTMLEYALESQAAFCLLTGEIGSGKSTLVRHVLRSLREDVNVGLVSNSHSSFRSITPWVLSALSVVPADDSDIAHYEALVDYLIGEYGKGRRTLLIFDEAQNLSIDTLEELRLLSNVNSEQDVALQVLLVGQPELRDKLLRPELTQFAQRVAVHYHLGALSLADTHAYIRHRMQVAGGNGEVFTPEAIAFIHARSRGIPRIINQLCDLALVYAYADRSERVTLPAVQLVLQDRNHGGGTTLFGADPVAPVAPPAVSRAALAP